MKTLILVGGILLLYFVLRWEYQKNPTQFTRRFLFTSIGLLILGVLYLAVTGKLHWLFALIAGLVPFFARVLTLLRFLPMLKAIQSIFRRYNYKSGATPGRSSSVSSRYVKMTLDHDSGVMSGQVIVGRFAGMALEEMDENQLQLLLGECADDADSVALLNTYLQRRFGDSWQGFEDGTANAGNAADGSETMSRDEALAILGLADNPTKEEVVKAHRRLMQKYHPDRGGSDYLAAKINHAKDVLLS